MRTSECDVACCRIDDVSLNSTKNVLSPVNTTTTRTHTNTINTAPVRLSG